MQDVDSAAKFIGAGAATVGVAGQLIFLTLQVLHKCYQPSFSLWPNRLVLLGTPTNLEVMS